MSWISPHSHSHRPELTLGAVGRLDHAGRRKGCRSHTSAMPLLRAAVRRTCAEFSFVTELVGELPTPAPSGPRDYCETPTLPLASRGKARRRRRLVQGN